jgi:hypothetical protein
MRFSSAVTFARLSRTRGNAGLLPGETVNSTVSSTRAGEASNDVFEQVLRPTTRPTGASVPELIQGADGVRENS